MGNQMEAAMIFAGTDFASVHREQWPVICACLVHSSFIGSRNNLGGLAVCNR